MRWLDPSSTSSSVVIMASLMGGNKRQFNCQTQGHPKIPGKRGINARRK